MTITVPDDVSKGIAGMVPLDKYPALLRPVIATEVKKADGSTATVYTDDKSKCYCSLCREFRSGFGGNPGRHMKYHNKQQHKHDENKERDIILS